MKVCAILRFGNHVNGVSRWIDYRGAHNADIGRKIVGTHIGASNPGFSAGQQALRPIRLAWRGIGVKSINSVMLRGRHQNIVRSTADGYVSYPEWLGVRRSIDGAGKTLAERRSFHARSIQRIFLAIHAIPG